MSSTYKTAVNRGELNDGVLQTWLKREVLENFEPNLYFYKAGEKPTVEAGYNTLGWAKFSQLDEDDVTAGTEDDDGVSHPCFQCFFYHHYSKAIPRCGFSF